MTRYCTYLRVSTLKQGANGLGISAQRSMCENFIKQKNGEHVNEFMDVESGTHRDRKGLWQAIDFCQKNGCALVIAKLDRLARDIEFTFRVINTGIDIFFTDMPVVNSFILGVFASVAQYEREMTSTRTKQALAVKKAQGAKLGAANETYQRNYAQKSKRQKLDEANKRGMSRTLHYLESKDVRMFAKIVRNVFPMACKDENFENWDWNAINTKNGNRQRILTMMRDYKELDNALFKNWAIGDDVDEVKLQVKLASYIASIRSSILCKKNYEENL